MLEERGDDRRGNGFGGTLVSGVLVVGFLQLCRVRAESEEGEEVVDYVVLRYVLVLFA